MKLYLEKLKINYAKFNKIRTIFIELQNYKKNIMIHIQYYAKTLEAQRNYFTISNNYF